MECTANVSHVTSPPAGRRPLHVAVSSASDANGLKILPLYKVVNVIVTVY